MKKIIIPLLIVLSLIIVFAIGAVLWGVGIYNGFVGMDEGVQTAWSQVEVQYQRRADLVPQLVSTVEGAADFEASTLQAVTEARTNWLNAGEGSIEDQMSAANSFDSALSRLLVTVESYPTLSATENFLTLQAELEGTENRVAVARFDYNTEAKGFNTAIKKVPAMLIANLFGFDAYPYFESDEGSEEAPAVEFDFE
jgi:LemA protein